MRLVLNAGSTESQIVYSRSFPLGRTGSASGTILVFLRASARTGGGGPIDSYVRSVDGEPMVIAYTVSPDTGWRYVAGGPRSAVLERVLSIRRLTLLLGVRAALVGLLAALALSYRNVMALSRLIRAIGGALSPSRPDSRAAFDYIESTVLRMRDHNAALQDAISRQRPFVRTSFFDRLIMGEFAVPDKIDQILQLLDLDMPEGLYATLVVDHSEYRTMYDTPILEELEAKQALLRTRLDAAGYEHLWLHTVDEHSSVLIFACPCTVSDKSELEESRAHCRRRLSVVADDLSTRLLTDNTSATRIAVGRLYGNLIDVSRSYGQAMNALSWARAQNVPEPVVYYRDIAVLEDQTYFLPIEYHARLMHVVMSGRADQTQSILEELRSENLSQRNLSAGMSEQFVNDLRGIAVRISHLVAQRGLEESGRTPDGVLSELARYPEFHPEFYTTTLA